MKTYKVQGLAPTTKMTQNIFLKNETPSQLPGKNAHKQQWSRQFAELYKMVSKRQTIDN